MGDISFYLRLAWLFTVICWALSMYCRSKPIDKIGGIGQPLPNPLCLVVCILAYVPFSGLRIDSGDTFYYILDFELISRTEQLITNSEAERFIIYFLR